MNSPEELVGRARELGRDHFAARAEAYDRDGRFPVENYDDLRAAGLLALCIPTCYGGAGANYATYCRVAREIGRWCPATVLTFNMHSCSMLCSAKSPINCRSRPANGRCMRRAASSRSLVLVDVFVADDQAIMPQGSYYLAATEWPHMFMTLCPSYLGLAGAAFDFTVRYLRGEVEGDPPATRRSVSKQLAVAQLRIKLEQASALFERAVGEAGYQPSALERARALAAHYTVMEHA